MNQKLQQRQRAAPQGNSKGSDPTTEWNNVNIYVANRRAPKYMKQTLTDKKGELDSNTVIAGNFNIPLTSMDISPKQKITRKQWL